MKPVTPLRLAATALYMMLWPAMILVLGGDARWLEGWLFNGWFVALCTITTGWLYRRDPVLLAERYRMPGSGSQRGWDRAAVYGLALGFAAWIAVMPLDARRFVWSPPFQPWLETAGGVLLVAAAMMLFRSFHDNTFLSPLVRIQTEREQHVVSTGVYGLVRHPMYLGAILMFAGGPLLLGSLLGLALALVLTLLLAARIVGEERLLVTRLDGYANYRSKVPFRLVPRVW